MSDLERPRETYDIIHGAVSAHLCHACWFPRPGTSRLANIVTTPSPTTFTFLSNVVKLL
ncbi:hypothetical protein J6590_105008 [Homalodisca vitripennis]|nr:hypothetical protein J6590_105008 [Homalodisca vitripennis]